MGRAAGFYLRCGVAGLPRFRCEGEDDENHSRVFKAIRFQRSSPVAERGFLRNWLDRTPDGNAKPGADRHRPGCARGHSCMVLYDLPAGTQALPEDCRRRASLPTAPQVATTSARSARRPCPPGHSPHHYIFTLYALDAKLNLPLAQHERRSRAQSGDTRWHAAN